MIKQQFMYNFSVTVLIFYCGTAIFKVCGSDEALSSEGMMQNFRRSGTQKKEELYRSLLQQNKELKNPERTQNALNHILQSQNELLKKETEIQSLQIKTLGTALSTVKKYNHYLMALNALSTITLIFYNTYSTIYSDSNNSNATCPYPNN